MRTTLEIDDDLFARALRKFPPGTSKRVVVQEALRALVEGPGGPAAAVVFGAFDHVPVRMSSSFDDPVPGFPGEDGAE